MLPLRRQLFLFFRRAKTKTIYPGQACWRSRLDIFVLWLLVGICRLRFPQSGRSRALISRPPNPKDCGGLFFIAMTKYSSTPSRVLLLVRSLPEVKKTHTPLFPYSIFHYPDILKHLQRLLDRLVIRCLRIVDRFEIRCDTLIFDRLFVWREPVRDG